MKKARKKPIVKGNKSDWDDNRHLTRNNHEEKDVLPKRGAMGGGNYAYINNSYLRKFIASRVGQRWDKVWAELCAQVPKGSKARHLLNDDIDYVIDINIVLDENGEEVSTSPHRWRFSKYYVNPKTGCVERRKVDDEKKTRSKYKPAGLSWEDEKALTRYYIKNDIFYLVTFKEVETENYNTTYHDCLEDKERNISSLIRSYGGYSTRLGLNYQYFSYQPISKKQLSGKEIKKAKLTR